MLTGLYRLVGTILGTKLFFWAEPNAKTFIKYLSALAVFILLIIYIHSEFLSWVNLSGDKSFLTYSYVIKNILIALAVLFFFLKTKRINANSNSSKNKIPNEDNIYTKEKKEDYFDKFREKKELRSKTDILLSRDEKKK